MPFATWWRGDLLPVLAPLPTFTAHSSTNVALIAHLSKRSPEQVNGYFQAGHRHYLGFMGEIPVAYGWMAMQKGGIEELQFSFTIPACDGYLWDFATLPEWRGRGIYPRLLQAILSLEQTRDHFWIGYAPGNAASAHGMSKAGFRDVGDFIISNNRVSGLTLVTADERAQAAATLLGFPFEL